MKFIPGLFFVAWLGALPGWAAIVWVAPYVQDVSQDRAVVRWATSGEAGLGEVRATGPTGVVRSSFSTVQVIRPDQSALSETIYLHRAELRGLDSATLYRYEVRLDGANAVPGRSYSFRTAGEGAIRFLVMGDSGDNGAAQKDLALRLFQEEASFLVHLGDIAYWEGTFAQFHERFFGIYPDLLNRMALFCVPGNHDYEFRDALAYRSFFEAPTRGVPSEGQGRYYSFDWGPVHFSVVDTNRPFAEALAGRGDMLRWLEQDLRSTRQPWRVVMLHHPPFPTSEAKKDDPISALVQQHITPILERHGVQLLLAGHEHIYQRTKARRASTFVEDGAGTVYVTSGAAGSQLYDPGEAAFVAASRSGSSFLRVDVSGNLLTMEAVGLLGEVRDRWVLRAEPVLFAEPIRDAASFRPLFAPGSLVSIFGWNLANGEAHGSGTTLPVELGGTKIQWGNRDLRLIYASPTQVNALLPQEISAPERLVLRSTQGEISVSAAPLAAAPGIFSRRSGRVELVAGLHSDGSLIEADNPAAPGEWISVFATGLGAMRGAPAYGQPAPLSPLATAVEAISVSVGGVGATVSFAGMAPGFWGLHQVNLRVPGQSGLLPLQIFAAGVGSNVVNLPVR